MADYLAGLFSRGNRIKREVKDFASNPANYVKQLVSLIAETGQDVSRTRQESIDLSKKQGGKNFTDEQMNEVIGNMIPGGGAIGLIRKGGRSDLIMTHETPISSVLRRVKEGLNIANPSYAINSARVDPFMKDMGYYASLVMNPSATHYLDPRIAPQNTVANRDIFTHRMKKGAETPAEFRMGREDPRRTEGLLFGKGFDFNVPGKSFGTIGAGDLTHDLQIMGSPQFKSLAAYERSRYGAMTLDPDKATSRSAVSNELFGNYRDIMEQLDALDPKQQGIAMKTLIEEQEKAALGGDYQAKKFLDVIKTGISSYAEMKSHTQLPLTDKTVSGIMFGNWAPAAHQFEADKLREAGRINIGTPKQVVKAAGIDPFDIMHSPAMGDVATEIYMAAKAGEQMPAIGKLSGVESLDLSTYKVRDAYGRAVATGDTDPLMKLLDEQYLDTRDFATRAAQAISTKDAGDSISHLLWPNFNTP